MSLARKCFLLAVVLLLLTSCAAPATNSPAPAALTPYLTLTPSATTSHPPLGEDRGEGMQTALSTPMPRTVMSPTSMIPKFQMEGKIAFMSKGENGKLQIFVINPDGSGRTQLTHVGENKSPIWSPNASQIAFASSRDGNWEIFVMNFDGSHQINLTNGIENGRAPAWSPDGSKIAFVSNRADPNGHDDVYATKSDIYVMNSDGTNQKRLTYSPGRYFGYSWSPDGQKIVFATYQRNTRWIYVMNADGTDQITLTNSSEDGVFPKWSPDGQKIIFTRQSHIYIMNADGNNQRKLTDESGAWLGVESEYSWSLDGSRIVFACGIDICVTDSDGKGLKNLTNLSNEKFCNQPTWSPDGHWISSLCSYTYDIDPSGNSEIFIVDVNGDNLLNITNSNEGEGVPVWSP